MPEERLMTVEEFWEIPEKPGTRLALVRGVPTDLRPYGGQQGLTV